MKQLEDTLHIRPGPAALCLQKGTEVLSTLSQYLPSERFTLLKMSVLHCLSELGQTYMDRAYCPVSREAKHWDHQAFWCVSLHQSCMFSIYAHKCDKIGQGWRMSKW